MKTQKLVLIQDADDLTSIWPYLPKEVGPDYCLFFKVPAAQAHRWIKARKAWAKAQDEMRLTYLWEDTCQ